MLRLLTGPVVCTALELAQVLHDVKGAKAVTIIARTEPALVGGKSCPVRGVIKVSQVNGFIGFHYEKSVNKEREREFARNNPDVEPNEDNPAHFEAGPRKWGTRLKSKHTDRKIPLVGKSKDVWAVSRDEVAALKPDELYLELKVQKSVDSQYELNGQVIDAETVKPHLRPSDNPHNVILRDYRLDRIQEIRIDGETYCLAVPVPEAVGV